ncbi:MAG: 50S ribosomal protein L25/general stress protein Ctc [Desulfobacteraceae bacterium]
MNNIELKAETRTTTGNSPARALRRAGRIPAILYGPDSETMMISVDTDAMENIIKDGNVGRSIFDLAVDGGKSTRAAMIKELQTDPVSRDILHIDFLEVKMDRKVKVMVPVIATGKSVGVEMGGMLQIIRRELEVFCLPNAIPQEITIDITDLDIGNSVHVEDIALEGDVEIPHEVDFTVLTVLSPKMAEEEEVEEEEEELAEGEEAEAAEAEEESAEE